MVIKLYMVYGLIGNDTRLLDWFKLDGKRLLGIAIALLKFGRKIIGWSKMLLGPAGI